VKNGALWVWGTPSSVAVSVMVSPLAAAVPVFAAVMV